MAIWLIPIYRTTDLKRLNHHKVQNTRTVQQKPSIERRTRIYPIKDFRTLISSSSSSSSTSSSFPIFPFSLSNFLFSTFYILCFQFLFVRARNLPASRVRSQNTYFNTYNVQRIREWWLIYASSKSDESDAYASDRCGEGREEEYWFEVCSAIRERS